MGLGQKLSMAAIAATAFSLIVSFAAWTPERFNAHEMVAAVNDAAVLPQLLPIGGPASPKRHYVEVIDSCGPHFDGECVNIRTGPGEEYPSIAKLRAGAVLETSE